MIDKEPKAVLRRYLDQARDAAVWKLDGLSEYDMRRPLTPTGTNLLGLVKHLALVEFGYFGETFGRPADEELPSDEAAANDPHLDLIAEPHESSAEILALYGRARAHSDATIAALDLDAPGNVAWWPDTVNPVTLQLIMVHVTTETHRHTGHADILREMIDGRVGHRADVANMPEEEAAYWAAHYKRVEDAAKAASTATPPPD